MRSATSLPCDECKLQTELSKFSRNVSPTSRCNLFRIHHIFYWKEILDLSRPRLTLIQTPGWCQVLRELQEPPNQALLHELRLLSAGRGKNATLQLYRWILGSPALPQLRGCRSWVLSPTSHSHQALPSQAAGTGSWEFNGQRRDLILQGRQKYRD